MSLPDPRHSTRRAQSSTSMNRMSTKNLPPSPRMFAFRRVHDGPFVNAASAVSFFYFFQVAYSKSFRSSDEARRRKKYLQGDNWRAKFSLESRKNWLNKKGGGCEMTYLPRETRSRNLRWKEMQIDKVGSRTGGIILRAG